VEKGFVEEVHYFDLNYHRGLPWYRAHFPRKGKDAPIAGDDSPYYLFHPLVPGRVAKDLPSAKLIVLLRNPVDRAYSHYNHEHRRGRETLSFEDAMAKEEERLEGEVERMEADRSYVSYAHQRFSYLTRGRYADQLERWFDLMPRERFLVMQSEDMFRDPRSAFDRTLEFLGLPAMELEGFDVFNPGGYSSMDGHTRERLEDHYRPHNERLFRLLGNEFDW
jgi:hypothetical protein